MEVSPPLSRSREAARKAASRLFGITISDVGGECTKKIEIPNASVGAFIGRGGETVRYLECQSGTKIQVSRDMVVDSHSRVVILTGALHQIAKAEQLIDHLIRHSSNKDLLSIPTNGGYYQQGYQSQPPTTRPGYCYIQPGAVDPGENPRYNTGQASYPGYPPQPTTGGYGAGWDHTSAPQNRQTSQGAVYGYYNQQPNAQQALEGPGAAHTENASYGYIQQGYVARQQPIPNPTIPSQGATWYATPSSSQSAYGQQQQSPSAQGRYPQSASAYPSHGASGNLAPASYGAPTTQHWYAAPPYSGGYSAPYGYTSSGGSAR